MKNLCIFDAQRRNYVTQNNIIKNKAGIGASQNGVTSLFLHPRPHFLYLQNSDKMQQSTPEVWMPIQGYPGIYYVSNLGRVKSVKKTERIMKLRKCKLGYMRLDIRYKKNRTTHKVHRLVASAFLSPDPQRPFVNHINHIRDDNRVINLEWVNQRENICHTRVGSGRLLGAHKTKSNKWRSEMIHNGKKINMGAFENEQDASNAYIQKSEELNIINKYINAC